MAGKLNLQFGTFGCSDDTYYWINTKRTQLQLSRATRLMGTGKQSERSFFLSHWLTSGPVLLSMALIFSVLLFLPALHSPIAGDVVCVAFLALAQVLYVFQHRCRSRTQNMQDTLRIRSELRTLSFVIVGFLVMLLMVRLGTREIDSDEYELVLLVNMTLLEVTCAFVLYYSVYRPARAAKRVQHLLNSHNQTNEKAQTTAMRNVRAELHSLNLLEEHVVDTISVELLMATDTGYDVFLSFLSGEFSTENALFVDAVHQFLLKFEPALLHKRGVLCRKSKSLNLQIPSESDESSDEPNFDDLFTMYNLSCSTKYYLYVRVGHIFNRYLMNGATMQVNVPALVSQRVHAMALSLAHALPLNWSVNTKVGFSFWLKELASSTQKPPPKKTLLWSMQTFIRTNTTSQTQQRKNDCEDSCPEVVVRMPTALSMNDAMRAPTMSTSDEADVDQETSSGIDETCIVTIPSIMHMGVDKRPSRKKRRQRCQERKLETQKHISMMRRRGSLELNFAALKKRYENCGVDEFWLERGDLYYRFHSVRNAL
ncbi:MAG: hypothetical protein MHM6MM_005554 [Cercozoa sp. M6MM]